MFLDRPTWKKWLLSVLAFFLAFHFVTFTHEVAGHGLCALVLGGTIDSIHVNWMGASGYAKTTLPDLNAWQIFIFRWAGIFITIILAGALWRWRNFFGWICTVCLFSSAFGYSILGLHFLYGDPRETGLWLQRAGLRTSLIWILIFIHMLVIHRWGQRIKTYRPSRSLPASILFLGTAALTVAMLNVAESKIHTNMTHQLIMASQPQLEALAAKRTWEEARREAAKKTPWPIQWVYYPLLFSAVVTGARRREG